MAIISQVASGMQTVLTTVSDTVAKTTAFIKRQRKLTGHVLFRYWFLGG